MCKECFFVSSLLRCLCCIGLLCSLFSYVCSCFVIVSFYLVRCSCVGTFRHVVFLFCVVVSCYGVRRVVFSLSIVLCA